MRDAVQHTGAIAADAVTLAELDGGTGRERVRIEWLERRLADAAGNRRVDDAGNLVWTFGPPPYRLALLVHVDDVFGAGTRRGVTERDGWLCGPGIGDNAVAVATAVAVCEHRGPGPLAVNAIAARASAAVEWRATDQAALDRQEAALAEILEGNP